MYTFQKNKMIIYTQIYCGCVFFLDLCVQIDFIFWKFIIKNRVGLMDSLRTFINGKFRNILKPLLCGKYKKLGLCKQLANRPKPTILYNFVIYIFPHFLNKTQIPNSLHFNFLLISRYSLCTTPTPILIPK